MPTPETHHRLTSLPPQQYRRAGTRGHTRALTMDADAVQHLADPELALLGGRAYRTNLPLGAAVQSLTRHSTFWRAARKAAA